MRQNRMLSTDDHRSDAGTVSVTYRGDLHGQARHGPSGSMRKTDAPVDNHGRGEAFSPADLLGPALATCTATRIEAPACFHWPDGAATGDVS
jgi:hypothetical protein